MIRHRWLEVTLKIGCANMCSYCPQKTILNSYKGNRDMSFETFKKILSNTSKDIQIHFSGFCEPFLSECAEDFMLYAFDQGYSVVLFSTLQGLTQEKVNKLKRIKFDEVRIHQYDGPSFNTTTFEKNIEMFKTIHPNMTISPVINISSRASNNFKAEHKEGKVLCNRINCNVVLPNGDLVLCCNDYSLRHYLGSMLNENYDCIDRESILNLSNDSASNLLCRECEWSFYY